MSSYIFRLGLTESVLLSPSRLYQGLKELLLRAVIVGTEEDFSKIQDHLEKIVIVAVFFVRAVTQHSLDYL